jgi:alanyl-tRNA synthetase
MAAEQGLTVDITGFNSLMNEQKDRSRVATKLKRLDGRGETLSLGAEQTSYLQKTLQCLPTNDAAKYVWDQSITTTVDAVYTSSGFVESIDTKEDKVYGFILKDTSFYAESGGQVPGTHSYLLTYSLLLTLTHSYSFLLLLLLTHSLPS